MKKEACLTADDMTCDPCPSTSYIVMLYWSKH